MFPRSIVSMTATALLLASASVPETLAQALVLTDARIVDADAGLVREGLTVVVEHGRIRAVGESPDIPDGAEIVDLEGRFLMPGLIDSHVHVNGSAGIRGDQIAAHRDLVLAYREQEPRSYLYWGFTTLIDLNQDDTTVRRWNAREAAPWLLACQGAPYTDGYGMAFNPDPARYDDPYHIVDPDRLDRLPADFDAGAHTPEAVIERVRFDTDAICVKLYHEPGFAGLFDFNTADSQTLRRAVEAAETAGLVPLIHANSLASWEAAEAAGFPVLAHGLWHWDDENGAGTDAGAALPARIAALLDRLAAGGASIQLTTRVIGGEIDLYRPELLAEASMAHTLPGGLLAWYASPQGGWFQEELETRIAEHPEIVAYFLGEAPSGEPAETSRRALERLVRLNEGLEARGIERLFASDTPSSPTWTNPPGLNGYWEMQQMVAMGMSPASVLRSATILNAERFGLAGEVGRIQPGLRANLLVLEHNPLRSLDVFDDGLVEIILDGRRFPREQLSAMETGQQDTD